MLTKITKTKKKKITVTNSGGHDRATEPTNMEDRDVNSSDLWGKVYEAYTFISLENDNGGHILGSDLVSILYSKEK